MTSNGKIRYTCLNRVLKITFVSLTYHTQVITKCLFVYLELSPFHVEIKTQTFWINSTCMHYECYVTLKIKHTSICKCQSSYPYRFLYVSKAYIFVTLLYEFNSVLNRSILLNFVEIRVHVHGIKLFQNIHASSMLKK